MSITASTLPCSWANHRPSAIVRRPCGACTAEIGMLSMCRCTFWRACNGIAAAAAALQALLQYRLAWLASETQRPELKGQITEGPRSCNALLASASVLLTSTVLLLAAVRMSPGRVARPSIMFSHAATMKCTCSAGTRKPVEQLYQVPSIEHRMACPANPGAMRHCCATSDDCHTIGAGNGS
jgi:hypothetical protein